MVSVSYVAAAAWAVVGALAAPSADPAAMQAMPDFELGGQSLARRQDYSQDYTTTGTINYTPSSSGYSVSFSDAGDFVVGKGWSTGTTRNITFSGSTSATAGTVLVSVYGWSTNPLVEYYIQEYSNGSGAAQGTKVGTVVSDGATYDIWKHQQVDQPSISGTSSTFWQYISVRQSGRASGGTVTVDNHFKAWANLGMDLGTLNYQVIATEGWGTASGQSKYTVSG